MKFSQTSYSGDHGFDELIHKPTNIEISIKAVLRVRNFLVKSGRLGQEQVFLLNK
jgi:hypothetical protein